SSPLWSTKLKSYRFSLWALIPSLFRFARTAVNLGRSRTQPTSSMKQSQQARNLRIFRLSVALSGLLLLSPAVSFAVGTRHFVIEQGSDFEKGELEGVAVDSTGYLHAGLDLGKIEILDAESVWTSFEHQGAILLGTGNEGKLFEVKTGQVREVASIEGALAITSIVRAFGKTLVGAIPGGKLYELKGGKLEEFTELKGAGHIWGLAFDESKNA